MRGGFFGPAGGGRPWAAAALAAGLFLFLAAPLMDQAGLNGDETFHAAAAYGLLQPGTLTPSVRWMPWMCFAYNGAVKAYWHYGIFKAFGIGRRSVRGATLALGAAALFFLVLLAARLYGPAAGAALGVLTASDPAWILNAVFDRGPSTLSLAFTAAGLWLLLAARGGTPSVGRLLGGGFLFGLAVWDKPHALWLICALLLCASAAAASGALREPRRRIGLPLLGVLAGAAPLIVFNAHFYLLSFTSPESLGWSFAEHLPRLAGWAAERWTLWLRALDASDLYLVISGVNGPDWAKWPRLITAAELAILAAAAAFHGARSRLGQAAAWLGAAGLFLLASFLAPYPMKVHHYYLIYAFPRLALLALAAGAFPVLAPKFPRALLLAVLGLLPVVAVQAAVLRRFSRDLTASGGSEEFSRTRINAAAWVLEAAAREPSQGFVDEARLAEVLRIETGGRIQIDKLPRAEDWIAADGLNRAAVLLYKEAYAVVSLNDPAASMPFFGGGELAAEFRARGGRLLYEIRRLRGAPGEAFLEEGRPRDHRLSAGLRAWFDFYDALAARVPPDQRAELWFHLAREAGAPESRLLPPAERRNPPEALLAKLAARALGRAKAAERSFR